MEVFTTPIRTVLFTKTINNAVDAEARPFMASYNFLTLVVSWQIVSYLNQRKYPWSRDKIGAHNQFLAFI